MNTELDNNTLHELGYIKGKVESIENKINNWIIEEQETHKVIMEKIYSMKEQLSLYRFMIMTAKAIGYTIIFILAFKFGDIKNLWTTFIKEG